MHARCSQSYVSQPRQPSVGGFRNRARHVEVKNRLRPSPLFRHAPPACVAASRSTVSTSTLADKIDVRAILIRRPVALEIVKKSLPIVREMVLIEVPQWKWKPVIDPNPGRSR